MPNLPVILTSLVQRAKKDLQKQLPLFQGYEEIVLFFDGASQVVRLPRQRGVLPQESQTSRLDSYKDPSDALQAKDPEAVRRAIWDAKPYRPDGIIVEIYYNWSPPQKHLIMSIHSEDLTRNYRDQVWRTRYFGHWFGKTSSCVLATDLLKKASQLGSWNLKQVIEEQLLD